MGVFSKYFNRSSDQNTNKFNQAFFKLIGSIGSSYDDKASTYVEEGFIKNPIVYSIVSQMSTKTSSVPFSIKKIDDKNQKSKRDSLLKSTRYNLTAQQRVKKLILDSKAFEEEYLELPFSKPNPLQTWSEFLELYKTFIKLTGNVYLYKLTVENGANSGNVDSVYILPSHLVNIVLKSNVDMISNESPIDCYKLIEGSSSITFTSDEITHIKYPNPNFDMNGSHLYGLSPIRSLLKNIESSNLALELNVKTMKNGGAFGLIHSKGQTPLTPEQAKGLKDRLVEMDNSSDKLAKIAGVSAEIGFTRLSMTTDELKLFDYLKFDKQQIADCLGWEVMSESKGDYGGTIQQIRKQRIIDNIIPDLNLLEEGFNTEILPNIKGYENTCLEFDYSELPEMQDDVKLMVDWVVKLKDSAMITPNDGLKLLNMPISENPLMDELMTNQDYLTLEQSLDDTPTLI